MSAENNRKIENLIRYGVVAEVDCAARRARVQSGEILTDWLPWCAFRAGTTKIWSPVTVGDPCASRRDLLARTCYEKREPNKYGEVSKKVIGFFNQQIKSFKAVLTRTKVYRLVKKSVLKAQQAERSEALKHCERSSPWSSVNNCTEQKIDNLTLFLNARQNDVEIVQKALKPICLPLNDRQLAYLLKGNLLVLNHKQSVRFINNKVEIIPNQEPVPFMGDAGEWFVQ
ncbi:phage baseplate assembly protein V [Avibacterium avium]|uniref:phage baseplate assembly protein V n=1 Tax=Avibacterium avium TaxID=751 RepID=UPI003BF839FE